MNASGVGQVFRLPDLGEGLTEAEILEWRVCVGDVVTVDQTVVAVETAKAAVDVPCPIAGTVVRLYGEPGSVIDVGQPLIAVAVQDGGDGGDDSGGEESGGSGNVLVGYGTSETRRSRRRAGRRAAAVATTESGSRPEVPRVISPVVRRLARTHAIDVAAVTPSGPGRVVLRRDVDAAIEKATTAVAPQPPPPETAIAQPPAAETAIAETLNGAGAARIPLRGSRRTIAEKLTRSRREIPDATVWVDADATALVGLKADIERARPDAHVGLLALFARICVAGLRRFPELNSSVDTEHAEIVRHPHIHLGFAAQTDRGLVVPVVHDAHRLTLTELAGRLRERTEEARAGRLTPQALTGGTFTLNNYGVFGVDGSTPIINHPEAAMLGVGRIADRPWAFEGEIRLRKVTQLSFTFDHRVCDGGAAGGFLRYVADCVERPAVLVADL